MTHQVDLGNFRAWESTGNWLKRCLLYTSYRIRLSVQSWHWHQEEPKPRDLLQKAYNYMI